VQRYFQSLANILAATQATNAQGLSVPLSEAVEWAVAKVKAMENKSHKLIFIGNGGSAGISSHMAIDYLKNGGVPAMAMNDGAALTCLSNDLGYEQVFAKQLEMHGKRGDLLMAISSSGNSKNILNAVGVAREIGCHVCTLSGFKPTNPLRALGDYNLFVASHEYGFVEISHLALCHAVLDIKLGWQDNASAAK
jgi:D-sedoheptulose 7-phosphate isomerase